MMKKIAIIGGGISGVFASIRIKELHPNYQVSIFEHNEKLLKKIYATGNGKCNFANTGNLEDKYNDSFAVSIIKDFNSTQIIDYFASIGVVSKQIDNNLVYPYSESAETVANKLLKRVQDLNINVYLETEVIDYDKSQIITNKGNFAYDKLIISVGGKSSNLGSDGSLWNTIKRHNYLLKEPSPSLCPIKTKENTKKIEGLRSKVLVSLYQKDLLIHKESGELLFKKDGLSGMVIFNTTHYINRLKDKNNITLHIDFAPNQNEEIDSLVHPKLANYLLDNHCDIHNTIFAFKGFYDYQFSQVTSGGLLVSELDNNLQSKKENNVFFIGEVVNIDAICGGYNMMWAFASAEKVAKNI